MREYKNGGSILDINDSVDQEVIFYHLKRAFKVDTKFLLGELLLEFAASSQFACCGVVEHEGAFKCAGQNKSSVPRLFDLTLTRLMSSMLPVLTYPHACPDHA
eukprot:1765254-Rhodomonas_salina.2